MLSTLYRDLDSQTGVFGPGDEWISGQNARSYLVQEAHKVLNSRLSL